MILSIWSDPHNAAKATASEFCIMIPDSLKRAGIIIVHSAER